MVEDSIYAFRQATENKMIVVYFALLTVSLCTFQVTSVCITKYASSTHMCTIDITRIVIIWVFFLIYPGQGHETFDYIQAIGFVTIAIGTIIFNEIYVPPLFGFNKNTKANKLQAGKAF